MPPRAARKVRKVRKARKARMRADAARVWRARGMRMACVLRQPFAIRIARCRQGDARRLPCASIDAQTAISSRTPCASISPPAPPATISPRLITQ
ncbi:hypothetical protein AQ914_15910 [Burkholderia pseudomallei]|nr:hypothetical protein AQ914_15910 [Burkholderia pseudomallei]